MIDWKPGDLALCIRGGEIVTHPDFAHYEFPVGGTIYPITAVVMHNFISGENVGLISPRLPINVWGDRVWSHQRFIKIDHLLEDEEIEEPLELGEFV